MAWITTNSPQRGFVSMGIDGKSEVYLGLGSNLGDRESFIRKALDRLGVSEGVEVADVSEMTETEPWGFDAENRFINCVARCLVDRSVTPERLLDICKETERELGRHDAPEYGRDGSRIYRSRNIDIDILFFGKKRIRTSRLTLPHPLILQRDFVLLPLRQIASKALIAEFPEYFKVGRR